MTSDGTNRFEQEHLERWWDVTRRYLFADMQDVQGMADAARGPAVSFTASQRGPNGDDPPERTCAAEDSGSAPMSSAR